MNYIYPPRPKSKVPPIMLPKMESRGIFLAQRKFNGDRCLIHYPGNGGVILYNRYGRQQKYKMTAALRQEFLALNLDVTKEHWLDGELMHPRIKDTVILYDALLVEGNYLFGSTVDQRLGILRQICNNPVRHPDPPIALEVSQHVWMVESFNSEFADRFNEFLHLDTIEGLVLKERASRLDSWGSKPYEVTWQVRCRKQGPTYDF